MSTRLKLIPSSCGLHSTYRRLQDLLFSNSNGRTFPTDRYLFHAIFIWILELLLTAQLPFPSLLDYVNHNEQTSHLQTCRSKQHNIQRDNHWSLPSILRSSITYFSTTKPIIPPIKTQTSNPSNVPNQHQPQKSHLRPTLI